MSLNYLESNTFESTERPVYRLDAVQLKRKRESDRNAQQVKKQQTRDHIAALTKKTEELPDNSKICSDISAAEKRTAQLEEELRLLQLQEESQHLGRDGGQKYGESMRLTGKVYDPVPGEYTDSEIMVTGSSNEDSASNVPSSIEQPREPSHSSRLTSLASAAWFVDDEIHHNYSTVAITTTISTVSTISTTSMEARNPFFRSRARVFSETGPSPTQRFPFPAHFIKQPQIHIWELPLCIEETDSPLGAVLLNIIKPRNIRTREPKFPTFNLTGDRDQFNALCPIAGVISDIFSRMSYRTLLDKVGTLVYMYSIYRW